MIRILLPAFAAALAVTHPAAAAEEQVLRLACHAAEPRQVFAFSIDLAAKDAVETVSGRRYAVSGPRDHLVLTDAGMPAFRIDRLTGAFVIDRQLRLEGRCETAERKF